MFLDDGANHKTISENRDETETTQNENDDRLR